MKAPIFKKRRIRHYSELGLSALSFIAMGYFFLTTGVLQLIFSSVLTQSTKPSKPLSVTATWIILFGLFVVLPAVNSIFLSGLKGSTAPFRSWWRHRNGKQMPKVFRGTGDCQMTGPGGQVHPSHYVLTINKKETKLCGRHLADYLDFDPWTVAGLVEQFAEELAPSYSGKQALLHAGHQAFIRALSALYDHQAPAATEAVFVAYTDMFPDERAELSEAWHIAKAERTRR